VTHRSIDNIQLRAGAADKHIGFDVAYWMRSNRLQLNFAKTEIIWSNLGRRLPQLPQTALRIGSGHVAPVRDLAILLDVDVSTKSHDALAIIDT